MSVIVGQDRLLSYFKNTSISLLSPFILLEGDNGSGRHLLCKELSVLYGLEYIDVKDCLSYSRTTTKSYSLAALKLFIEDCYTKINACLLVFDCSDITHKEEPLFLKFLEEPPNNIHVFMLTTNTSNVLDTIRNRALLLTMDRYDMSTLETFLTSDMSIQSFEYLCRTPGDVMLILKLQGNISELSSLCNNIVSNINNATYSNVLNISRLFFDDKGNIVDSEKFMLFLKLLEYTIFVSFINGYSNYELWEKTVKYIGTYNSPLYISKRALFENYLYDIKGMM